MELTLNILWVCVSIAMFVAILRSARRWTCAVTVAICLTAIAFPIISITDDLCNDVLFADPLSVRRARHRADIRPFAVAANLPSAEILIIDHACSDRLVIEHGTIPQLHDTSTIALRGPPLHFC
ncbi:MAG: hypothetical protein M3041_10905 [Acidobacteriota bacterium]|nr:hypothetical protein [Acidobacteriota bacterium]